MNAYHPKTAPSYGYDSPCASFQGTGARGPIASRQMVLRFRPDARRNRWSTPPKNGACSVQYAVNFVRQNQAAAIQVAAQLSVSPEDILGLSAAETAYGRSSIALQSKNFFSLHGGAGAPFAIGVRRAGDGPMSVFPSFLASAQSFAAQYGSLVKGLSDPTAFVGALVPRFNSAKAPLGNPNFVPDTVRVINAVKVRMGC